MNIKRIKPKSVLLGVMLLALIAVGYVLLRGKSSLRYTQNMPIITATSIKVMDGFNAGEQFPSWLKHNNLKLEHQVPITYSANFYPYTHINTWCMTGLWLSGQFRYSAKMRGNKNYTINYPPYKEQQYYILGYEKQPITKDIFRKIIFSFSNDYQKHCPEIPKYYFWTLADNLYDELALNGEYKLSLVADKQNSDIKYLALTDARQNILGAKIYFKEYDTTSVWLATTQAQ